MSPPFALARFSVQQYHRMVERGALTEDERVKLIDGWLVEKLPKGPAHAFAIGQAEALLRELIPADRHVRDRPSTGILGARAVSYFSPALS